MFTKKGIDICSAKSMFNFLHDHFMYFTLNSWNGLKSIAHNVKIYNLGLEGDHWNALAFLEADRYAEINEMCYDFEREHPGYEVGFNGRSSGYLILTNKENNRNILPDEIVDYDYEGFKDYCKEYYGSVKNYMSELRECTKLVRDFDKLVDEMRNYVNELSKRNFSAEKLEEAVNDFNFDYENDLEQLGIDFLKVVDGKVDFKRLNRLDCLSEAFERYLKRYADWAKINFNLDTGIACLERI